MTRMKRKRQDTAFSMVSKVKDPLTPQLENWGIVLFPFYPVDPRKNERAIPGQNAE
jgi:hypothetical protein